jgi:hypothetical protein
LGWQRKYLPTVVRNYCAKSGPIRATKSREMLNATMLQGNSKQRAKRAKERNKMKCLDIEIIIIRAIVCLISLTGCIWHLTDISKIYFSYETDVNVDFEREVMVQIPGMTVCINASLAAREDYIISKYPELVNSTDYKVRQIHWMDSVLVYTFSFGFTGSQVLLPGRETSKDDFG